MTMIEKKDLRHGAYYAGESRSVKIARWNANQGLFYGKRDKGASVDFFTHPQDSVALSATDSFTPLKEIEHSPIRIPISY
jgi:hypothetical protein